MDYDTWKSIDTREEEPGWLEEPEPTAEEAAEYAVDAAAPHMRNEADWLMLAMAALDQAGVSVADQRRVLSIVCK